MDFYNDVKTLADVSLVYIAEAHASDEWPINSSRCTRDGKVIDVAQPTELKSRVEIAKRFTAEFNMAAMRLLVDDPSGPEAEAFERHFAPWPLRFYILARGHVVWIAEPENGTFSIPLLREALMTYCRQHP